jgi:hypothetical protein
VRFDLETGARTDIAGDPHYDINDVQFSPRTKTPIGKLFRDASAGSRRLPVHRRGNL